MVGTLTISGKAGEPVQMVTNSIDAYDNNNTGDWHFLTGTAVDVGNWYYAYPEPQKPEVTVHYDLHYDTPKKEVREEMAGLYRVIAVDYKNRKVVVDKELIADNEEDALLWGLGDVVREYAPKDLDKKAIKVMDVRKVPEPQKVQVVEG